MKKIVLTVSDEDHAIIRELSARDRRAVSTWVLLTLIDPFLVQARGNQTTTRNLRLSNWIASGGTPETFKE